MSIQTSNKRMNYVVIGILIALALSITLVILYYKSVFKKESCQSKNYLVAAMRIAVKYASCRRGNCLFKVALVPTRV
jgi:hypothetical protein